ncbi:tobH protein [Rhodococcus sp. D2-41]|uniref:tobH protein n=1 Tax=Speluncibacter jeojiensis TaxID=2710754 RepID=UPI00240F6C20|nr:tobH protein [Rhodococcus sp. D2-41]MDG3008800.1 tobH protein [Rhodococcus sp. D2-41]
MTAPASDIDFDDVEALLAGDTRGALRSAALGGAQVRAVAAAVEEGALARLAGLRPRSVVLVAGHGSSARAAGLVVATLGARLGVPLIHVAQAPSWVGPLDLVVVTGEDAGDPRLVHSVAQAVRHGAEVIVAAPDEGPLRAAGAGRAITVPPRMHVLDINSLMHHLAVMLAALEVVESGTATAPSGFAEFADVLDGEALRNHPRRELFHNPAKSLASRMQGRRVVLAGDSAGARELAGHGAAVLLRVAGTVAAAAELSDVLAAGPALTSGSLFHDPDFDEPGAGARLVRVFALSTSASARAVEMRMAALPDADLVLAGEEPTPAHLHRQEGRADHGAAGRPGVVQAPAAPPAAELDDRAEIEQLAVLATRLEMAAAYLQLVGAG